MNRFTRLGVGISMVFFSLTILHSQEPLTDDGVIHLEVPNALEIAWNYDLSRLAVLTGEEILVWDTDDWNLLYTIQDADTYTIGWHPHENIIAGLQGGLNERLMLWNGDTGEFQTQIVRQLPSDIVGIAVLHTLSWSPNGNQIASDSVMDAIGVWDLETETYTPFIPASERINVTELSWSPGGTYLLAATTDGTISVWDAQAREQVLTVEGHEHAVWHPDALFFAGAGPNNKVSIWSLEHGQIEAEFVEHANTITSIDWHIDGNTLLSTDADGHLFIWEFETASRLPLNLPNATFVRKASWRGDGQQLGIITRDEIIILPWE